LRDRVSTIQSELEFHEEKVKKMKEQFKEWKKYIDSFNGQLNKKIDEIDIEKNELQRAKKNRSKNRENNPDVE
jgi:chromosome segregation ATPase